MKAFDKIARRIGLAVEIQLQYRNRSHDNKLNSFFPLVSVALKVRILLPGISQCSLCETKL